MADQPIAHTADGRPVYDNTPTVVAVLVYIGKKLLAIRRSHEPGKGLIGLPGGFHMKGESWQEAGAREVLEETGYVIDPKMITQLGETVTDEYGNNLMIARYWGDVTNPTGATDGEAEEVLLLERAGPKAEWAFPRHWAATFNTWP